MSSSSLCMTIHLLSASACAICFVYEGWSSGIVSSVDFEDTEDERERLGLRSVPALRSMSCDDGGERWNVPRIGSDKALGLPFCMFELVDQGVRRGVSSFRELGHE